MVLWKNINGDDDVIVDDDRVNIGQNASGRWNSSFAGKCKLSCIILVNLDDFGTFMGKQFWPNWMTLDWQCVPRLEL